MAEPSEHSIDDYNKLLQLLRVAAEKHGLFLHSAGIIPPFSDGAPVLIQASFTIADEEEEVSEEQENFDSAFKDLVKGQTDFDADDVRIQLLKEIENGEGLFKDFNDPDL